MKLADRLEGLRRFVEQRGERAGFDAQDRLRSLRQLLAHARERTGIELGFVLWDGSTVPQDLAANGLAVVIADEGAVAALVRRPKLETIASLWVTKRIDIRGGTLFDLAAERPKLRTREIRKNLDKKLLLTTLAKFLPVHRGGPWPLEDVPDEPPAGGDARKAKKNIAYHYDVSNRFYALWLDSEMVYSCAYFPRGDATTLEEAQVAKLDMICRKLRLAEGERFLDIGCGWGGLVCHAARNYGVRAHGITLSEAQLELARAKVARLGLADRVTLELKDFRSLDGEYDKIASVGMFEHVAPDQHAAYFTRMRALLRPGGIYLHHAITRPAKRARLLRRRKRPEFALLTKFIFPGGELDHIGGSVASLERFGFEVHDVEGWREHYQRTCRHWHDRLLASYDAAVAEVGEIKTRMWLVYLAACSIAFERNTVGLFQTVASTRRRGPSGLPPTREDLYKKNLLQGG
ncbi:MAG TPA: cyclopropane-fatty-acyl-phospholipid synthase family protein, partial [Beijerinckiaceae bacterium]|nr:cyclopropane-fatty-acyl-phospholipid synthase family protein [Beijerinckiaceae bacterium]